MLTCSHSLDVATLIMRGINIPTSAGLIRLSFHTKTDCSQWGSSCAGMLPWSLHLNCSLNVVAPTRNQRAAVRHHTPPPRPNVLHLKRLSQGRRFDELDQPSGFATDRDVTKESARNKRQQATGVSAPLQGRHVERKREMALRFFSFFRNTGAIVGERVDLAILLVLQPEWRNEVAFIKRPGQVWVLKCLLACL